METLIRGAPETSVAEGEARGRYVRDMFARITPRYDLLNRILSLGLDQGWRRRTLELLEPAPGMRMLDACCGTGDLALMATRMAPGIRVTGSDFCAPMVGRARSKSEAGDRAPDWVVGDSLRLPFADASFDRAAVAFGIRNLGDLDRGLDELFRVLAPGGRLAILEFSTPTFAPFRWLYRFYLAEVLPRIGSLGSRQGDAYRYLPETILRFPDQAALAARMETRGFRQARFENRTLGVVAIHLAERPR